MSQGSNHADLLMAPLSMGKLSSENYKRVYEAVDELSDGRAHRLVKAIGRIILAERERCAKVCEDMEKDIVCPEECAAAIRQEPTDDTD